MHIHLKSSIQELFTLQKKRKEIEKNGFDDFFVLLFFSELFELLLISK